MFSFHQIARAQLNKTVGSVADSLALLSTGITMDLENKNDQQINFSFHMYFYLCLQYGTVNTHTHTHTHTHTQKETIHSVLFWFDTVNV